VERGGLGLVRDPDSNRDRNGITQPAHQAHRYHRLDEAEATELGHRWWSEVMFLRAGASQPGFGARCQVRRSSRSRILPHRGRCVPASSRTRRRTAMASAWRGRERSRSRAARAAGAGSAGRPAQPPGTRRVSSSMAIRPSSRASEAPRHAGGIRARVRPAGRPLPGAVSTARSYRATSCDADDDPRGPWQISGMYRLPRHGGDGRRTAHNPEVAGSNPPPLPSKCRSGPHRRKAVRPF